MDSEEEWEVLSEDGAFDFHTKVEKKRCSRVSDFSYNDAVELDYFICPPSKQHNSSALSNSLFQAEQKPDYESEKEIPEVPIVEIRIKSPSVLASLKESTWVANFLENQDASFLRKVKENQFVDMKLDSPRSSYKEIKPQIDLSVTQIEGKEEALKVDEDLAHNIEKPSRVVIEQEREEKNCLSGLKLNFWRWKVSGIGALCSMGVAVAATCVVIFGNHQRQKQNHPNRNKLRLQLYADDKSIKQVVHHATKLNQALSSLRGVPLTSAEITFGGYYNGP